MIFRIAALKPKNGVTSAQALRRAGAIKGYLPPHFALKAGNWRASESPVSRCRRHCQDRPKSKSNLLT